MPPRDCTDSDTVSDGGDCPMLALFEVRDGPVESAATVADATCWVCCEGADSPNGAPSPTGCACRGSAGFAHLPCLIDSARYRPDTPSHRHSAGIPQVSYMFPHYPPRAVHDGTAALHVRAWGSHPS